MHNSAVKKVSVLVYQHGREGRTIAAYSWQSLEVATRCAYNEYYEEKFADLLRVKYT